MNPDNPARAAEVTRWRDEWLVLGLQSAPDIEPFEVADEEEGRWTYVLDLDDVLFYAEHPDLLDGEVDDPSHLAELNELAKQRASAWRRTLRPKELQVFDEAVNQRVRRGCDVLDGCLKEGVLPDGVDRRVWFELEQRGRHSGGPSTSGTTASEASPLSR